MFQLGTVLFHMLAEWGFPLRGGDLFFQCCVSAACLHPRYTPHALGEGSCLALNAVSLTSAYNLPCCALFGASFPSSFLRCSLITPWNFPIAMITRKAGAATST